MVHRGQHRAADFRVLPPGSVSGFGKYPMPPNEDHAHVASLQVEVRDLQEEVQRLRSRYHDLSNLIAPLVLASEDTERHDTELREIRSIVDRGRGVWLALTIIGTLAGSLAAGVWAIVTHYLK